MRASSQPNLSLQVRHDPSFRGQPRHRAAIGQALSHYAVWSPRPVTLDGRRLDNVLEEPNLGGSDFRRPIVLLAADAVPDIPSLRVRAALTERKLESTPRVDLDPEAWKKVQLTLGGPLLALGLISASSRPSRRKGAGYYDPGFAPSQVVWISDGVEVAREALPLNSGPVPLLIAVSAEGLTTDLSGLVPRPGPELTRRRNAAIRAVSARFPDTTDSRPDFSEHAISDTSAAGWAGVLVGGFVVLIQPVVGLVVMGIAGAMALSNSGQQVHGSAYTQGLDQLGPDLRKHAASLDDERAASDL